MPRVPDCLIISDLDNMEALVLQPFEPRVLADPKVTRRATLGALVPSGCYTGPAVLLFRRGFKVSLGTVCGVGAVIVLTLIFLK